MEIILQKFSQIPEEIGKIPSFFFTDTSLYFRYCPSMTTSERQSGKSICYNVQNVVCFDGHLVSLKEANNWTGKVFSPAKIQ